MAQVADNRAYKYNDCCGYFWGNMANFNKGGKQDQAQAKGDYISC